MEEEETKEMAEMVEMGVSSKESDDDEDMGFSLFVILEINFFNILIYF